MRLSLITSKIGAGPSATQRSIRDHRMTARSTAPPVRRRGRHGTPGSPGHEIRRSGAGVGGRRTPPWTSSSRSGSGGSTSATRPAGGPSSSCSAAVGHPVSISDIAARLPEVPRSSAYRHLVDLQSAGVVRRIAAKDEFARFELAEDLTEHHHHLLCTICGRVIDVTPTPAFERTVADMVHELAEQQGFRPSSHALDVTGHCADCAVAFPLSFLSTALLPVHGCRRPGSIPAYHPEQEVGVMTIGVVGRGEGRAVQRPGARCTSRPWPTRTTATSR